MSRRVNFLLKLAVIISILLISFSVFYYYVIYLPGGGGRGKLKGVSKYQKTDLEPKSYELSEGVSCSIRYSGVERSGKYEILARLLLDKDAEIKKNSKKKVDPNNIIVVFKDERGFELGQCVFEGVVLGEYSREFDQDYNASFWIEKEKYHQIENAETLYVPLGKQ